MAVTQIRLDTQAQNATLTPAKISTTATDDFTFPRDVIANRDLTADVKVNTDEIKGRTGDLLLEPFADSTTAIKLANASGTAIATIDTSTNVLNMNSHKITNVADPTLAQDAATKNYVDSIVNGLSWKTSVEAATTTNLATTFPGGYTYNNGSSGVGATLTETTPGDGAFVIDGYTASVNDRILIKNETGSPNAAYNGIYTVTATGNGSSIAWVLTRALDQNTPAEFPASAVISQNGSTNADLGFVCTTEAPITIGTTHITWVTFTSSVVSYFAGNGLDLTGSTFSISTDNSLTANVGGSTPSLVVKEDPVGAISTGASGIKVNVDNSTIDISSNNIEVKTGGITNTQISASAAIDFSKLHSLTSAHILLGNGSNVATDTAVSGDASITNAGVVSISAGLSNHIVVREVPTGSINSSNVTFTLAHTPASGYNGQNNTSEEVYLNGLLQSAGGSNDYTISSNTITFNVAPQTGSFILVNYIY